MSQPGRVIIGKRSALLTMRHRCRPPDKAEPEDARWGVIQKCIALEQQRRLRYKFVDLGVW
jgi:hypothetical protein